MPLEDKMGCGIVLGNSPTQTVGYVPVSALEKVRHSIPLLSLDKTKQVEELVQMAVKSAALLMLKLDGLTIKLCYENGQLVEASTRGDGDVGELITHNVSAFFYVPIRIPHKGRLVITGEGFIHKDDFEKMKDGAFRKEDKRICNARNLASGSIRLLNPASCKKRHVYFYAFNVIEGMAGFEKIADSRGKLLEAIGDYGFDTCPFVFLPENATLREIEDRINKLKNLAEDKKIPIDGCFVSRASLYNLSFIRDLELYPGCRILVSKWNMIIPHVEENLDRGYYSRSLIPKKCPCCGKTTRVFSRAGDKGRLIETLYCDNKDCSSQILRRFIHFAGKKAMDISGGSDATIERFVRMSFLKTFPDFYHLDRYRNEIIWMEGFGEKSYNKIIDSVERSRNTTFTKYLVGIGYPHDWEDSRQGIGALFSR